jgi:hypothetical protein
VRAVPLEPPPTVVIEAQQFRKPKRRRNSRQGIWPCRSGCFQSFAGAKPKAAVEVGEVEIPALNFEKKEEPKAASTQKSLQVRMFPLLHGRARTFISAFGRKGRARQ